jgi:hypothetical protein
LLSDKWDWVCWVLTKFTKFNQFARQTTDWTTVLLNFENKTQWSPDVLWISTWKKVSCDHSKSNAYLTQFPTSCLCKQAFSCLTNIMSKERNCLLRDNCGCVCQKFGKEFVGVFVKNLVKNSTFVQKETNWSLTLKVNLILTVMETLFWCLSKLS